jgi:hypothetical protein
MSDSNRLELVVEADVNKANASIKSSNTSVSREMTRGEARRLPMAQDALYGSAGG